MQSEKYQSTWCTLQQPLVILPSSVSWLFRIWVSHSSAGTQESTISAAITVSDSAMCLKSFLCSGLLQVLLWSLKNVKSRSYNNNGNLGVYLASLLSPQSLITRIFYKVQSIGNQWSSQSCTWHLEETHRASLKHIEMWK